LGAEDVQQPLMAGHELELEPSPRSLGHASKYTPFILRSQTKSGIETHLAPRRAGASDLSRDERNEHPIS
jgi:hypothetical protein